MPLCKNDPKRKYKGDEPSPKGLGWCAHGEKEGKVCKGLDGNKWIVKKVSSGSLRWVKDSFKRDKQSMSKINHPKCKKYFTHDNGYRPYLVYVGKNEIFIYEHNEKNNDDITYTQFVAEYKNVTKIFIGKSPLNKMTKFSNGYGKKFDGNSVLVELRKHTYIYIGEKIYKFITTNPITKYISPVGNNDDPYPYAVDSNNNYYLMLNTAIITSIPSKYKSDPYEYYLTLILMTPDEAFTPAHEPLIKNYDDIKEFYIGTGKYTLTYSPTPDNEYDRLKKTFKKNLYIKKLDNKKYKLTKPSFITLMNNFGKVINVNKLNVISSK